MRGWVPLWGFVSRSCNQKNGAGLVQINLEWNSIPWSGFIFVRKGGEFSKQLVFVIETIRDNCDRTFNFFIVLISKFSNRAGADLADIRHF